MNNKLHEESIGKAQPFFKFEVLQQKLEGFVCIKPLKLWATVNFYNHNEFLKLLINAFN